MEATGYIVRRRAELSDDNDRVVRKREKSESKPTGRVSELANNISEKTLFGHPTSSVAQYSSKSPFDQETLVEPFDKLRLQTSPIQVPEHGLNKKAKERDEIKAEIIAEKEARRLIEMNIQELDETANIIIDELEEICEDTDDIESLESVKKLDEIKAKQLATMRAQILVEFSSKHAKYKAMKKSYETEVKQLDEMNARSFSHLRAKLAEKKAERLATRKDEIIALNDELISRKAKMKKIQKDEEKIKFEAERKAEKIAEMEVNFIHKFNMKSHEIDDLEVAIAKAVRISEMKAKRIAELEARLENYQFLKTTPQVCTVTDSREDIAIPQTTALGYRCHLQNQGQVYSVDELHNLLELAVDYARDIGAYFTMSNHFIRENPPYSFRNNILEPRMKDFNGDRRSPINGKLKGLFFSTYPFINCASPFGSSRLKIPSDLMFDDRKSLYFVDFYCKKSGGPHYVTLVMTTDASPVDSQWRSRLVELSIYNNPFLKKVGSDIMVCRTSRFHVELFYTDEIDINYMKSCGAELIHGNRSTGTSCPGGIPKNTSCNVCNLKRK